MMVSYEGVNLHLTNPIKESFNFYHSQVRITIERCFGILIARWGIFWHDLKYDIAFIMEIVHCCCRLHNFCIDHNTPLFNDLYVSPPHVAADDNGILIDDEWRNVVPDTLVEDGSLRVGNDLREQIMKVIEENAYVAILSHHKIRSIISKSNCPAHGEFFFIQ